MTDHNPDDIEESLGRLVPKPAPSGLRQRVLDSALPAHKNAAVTPRMRAVAVVCSILIGVILGADFLLRRHESAQMAALLDGRSSARTASAEMSELAEMMDERGAETNSIGRFHIMAASAIQKLRGHDIREARKRLKGWLENESSENII